MERFYDYYFSEIFDDVSPNTDFEEIPLDGGVLLSYGRNRATVLKQQPGNGWEIEFGDRDIGGGAYLTQVKGTFDPTTIPEAINRAFGYFKKHGISPSYIKFDAVHDEASEKDGFTTSAQNYKSLESILSNIISKYPDSIKGLGNILNKAKGLKKITASDLSVLNDVSTLGERITHDPMFSSLIPFSFPENYTDAGRRGGLYMKALNKGYGMYITKVDNAGREYTVHLSGF